jgi:hypothetical protein
VDDGRTHGCNGVFANHQWRAALASIFLFGDKNSPNGGVPKKRIALLGDDRPHIMAKSFDRSNPVRYARHPKPIPFDIVGFPPFDERT